MPGEMLAYNLSFVAALTVISRIPRAMLGYMLVIQPISAAMAAVLDEVDRVNGLPTAASVNRVGARRRRQ